VIPNSAVQRGPKGLFAWVVRNDNTAEPRPIETGPSIGDLTIVVAGVQEGDRIVTGGHYKLKHNATVSLSMPQPPPAKGST
jgi:multidrug efflux system membrane fusion protein